MWSKAPDTETETTGYILKMAVSGSLNFSVIYYGYNLPQTLYYTATGLSTGMTYQFKISSINFNGESPLESAVFDFNACNIPSSFGAPFKIASTTSSITLGWQRPEDDGGCPLIGFSVFSDNGLQGPLTYEMNIGNDPAVRNTPTLRRLVVTNFPLNSGGSSFVFKVTVYNREGQTDSGYASYILAGVPTAPSLSPQLVASDTNVTTITVTLPLIPDSNNGDSAIISYELEIDDGQGGNFSPAGGLSPLSLVTTYYISQDIKRGRTYRLRYRTLNGVGFSDYSHELYATAANVPIAPPSPQLVSATGSSITLEFFETIDNGGT